MKFQELYNEMVQSTEMIRALLAGLSQEEAQLKKSQKERVIGGSRYFTNFRLV